MALLGLKLHTAEVTNQINFLLLSLAHLRVIAPATDNTAALEEMSQRQRAVGNSRIWAAQDLNLSLQRQMRYPLTNWLEE